MHLCAVHSVGEASGPEAVAEAERRVVFPRQCDHVIEVLVERVLPAVDVHPFGEERSASADHAADAALLVDPYNIEEMTAAMSKLLSDKELRLELCKKGKTRAGVYSWEKLAKEYLQLYRQLAQNNQPGYSLEF